VRAYLNAGIMDGGVVMERYEGTPQGGPLSPLLANVLLDEVDRALEARGHYFVRYADDANVYVRSRRAVSAKALATFKQRVRQLTRRSGGRSLQAVVDRLRSYLLGWKADFGLSQTPGVWRRLDEWLRHRIRAIQLKQWKRGTTMFRELRVLGASHEVARRIAANSRRWWNNSGRMLNCVLTLAWFDRLGLPRLA